MPVCEVDGEAAADGEADEDEGAVTGVRDAAAISVCRVPCFSGDVRSSSTTTITSVAHAALSSSTSLACETCTFVAVRRATLRARLRRDGGVWETGETGHASADLVAETSTVTAAQDAGMGGDFDRAERRDARVRGRSLRSTFAAARRRFRLGGAVASLSPLLGATSSTIALEDPAESLGISGTTNSGSEIAENGVTSVYVARECGAMAIDAEARWTTESVERAPRRTVASVSGSDGGDGIDDEGDLRGVGDALDATAAGSQFKVAEATSIAARAGAWSALGDSVGVDDPDSFNAVGQGLVTDACAETDWTTSVSMESISVSNPADAVDSDASVSAGTGVPSGAGAEARVG